MQLHIKQSCKLALWSLSPEGSWCTVTCWRQLWVLEEGRCLAVLHWECFTLEDLREPLSFSQLPFFHLSRERNNYWLLAISSPGLPYPEVAVVLGKGATHCLGRGQPMCENTRVHRYLHMHIWWFSPCGLLMIHSFRLRTRTSFRTCMMTWKESFTSQKAGMW